MAGLSYKMRFCILSTCVSFLLMPCVSSDTTPTGTVSSSILWSNASAPITLGPQTATETGTFTTSTASIDGLTANSATTTSAGGHQTILPIWFVSPGIGILVLPGPGVIAGGILPPPVGYPALTIGPDGSPSSADPPTTDPSTTPSTSTDLDSSAQSISSMTSSSSCSSCSICSFGAVSSFAIPSDIADIDPDFPLIIPGGNTPAGHVSTGSTSITYTSSTTSALATTSAPGPPTQSATPIDQPSCASNTVSADDIPNPLGSTNNDLRDLLYRIREELCGQPCSAAPSGVPGSAVSVFNSDDNAECEIRVGVSASVEAWFYRSTEPVGVELQECWDSSEYIIDNCVNDNPNKGWWNGDHVYQFYEGGVRPLNDASAKTTFQLTQWLGASTAGLQCDKDCSGNVPNPGWCAENCPQCTESHVCARSVDSFYSRRSFSDVEKRNVESQQANCGINYKLPDYPSTTKSSKAANPKAGSADLIPAITKWIDWEDTNNPQGCGRTLNIFPQRVTGHEYATEHIWEKHFVKTFLNWLSFNPQEQNDAGFNVGPVASCTMMKSIFATTSTTAGSIFENQTPAQALAETISCFGTLCPEDNRLSEFGILESGVNGMKTIILGKLSDLNTAQIPKCTNNIPWSKMVSNMEAVSMAFTYMRDSSVAAVFSTVNSRFRAVLAAIDSDPFYANIRPQQQAVYGTNTFIAHDSWADAFDYWMSGFLYQAEMKMRQWMFECVATVQTEIDDDMSLSAGDKQLRKQWVQAQSTGGLFASSLMEFGTNYEGLMSTDWA